jgi:hypothetical protein
MNQQFITVRIAHQVVHGLGHFPDADFHVLVVTTGAGHPGEGPKS